MTSSFPSGIESIWPSQQHGLPALQVLVRGFNHKLSQHQHQPETLLIYLRFEEYCLKGISTIFFLLFLPTAITTVLSYIIRKQCLNLVFPIDHLYQISILCHLLCLLGHKDCVFGQGFWLLKNSLEDTITPLPKVHRVYNKFCLEFCFRNTFSIRKSVGFLSLGKDN